MKVCNIIRDNINFSYNFTMKERKRNEEGENEKEEKKEREWQKGREGKEERSRKEEKKKMSFTYLCLASNSTVSSCSSFTLVYNLDSCSLSNTTQSCILDKISSFSKYCSCCNFISTVVSTLFNFRCFLSY